MKRLTIPLGERSYPVLVGDGLLESPASWRDLLPSGPAVIITNDRVAPLYLDRLLHALPGPAAHTLVLPDGEAEKNFDNYQRAIGFLADHGIRRDACLLALGGGVIGDLCGFVAATWMRGVRFVQFPTTLLAQVDASVGGKTAINIPAGKNLVGAFHQPSLVVADTATLTTLDEREYRAGLAEVVKAAAIRDADFLDDIETHADALLSREAAALIDTVARSIAHKAEVVAQDEREAGVRALLNFGHTFGHAIETHTGYTRFLHGEAVAMGMVVAARLSEHRRLCPPGVTDRLAAILHRLGLPVTMPADLEAEELLRLMGLDKKHTSMAQRFILLRALGDAIIDTDSDLAELRDAIEACIDHRE
jgi:3-dehydroquinate synthase